MFDLTGFDADLLIEPDEQDDIIPEDVPPVAKLGDLWQLGRHRILCGDATKERDVERIMGGVLAKLIFTSPPYNMGGGMYETYEDNLKKEEYINFNIKVLSNFQKYLKGFVFWNISYNKNARDSFIEIIYKILKETGLKFLELIVWNKKHGMPITSKEMMTRQYEDILLVGDDENIHNDLELFFCGRNDKRAWFNKKTQKGITNYWEVGTNKTQLENHLACYPVALPVKGIILMTNIDDIVVDPFGGSGSTLIACEKTNRICYMVELDPKYCDIIIQRYVNYAKNENIIKNSKELKWKITD
jgi:DNA modification methylase